MQAREGVPMQSAEKKSLDMATQAHGPWHLDLIETLFALCYELRPLLCETRLPALCTMIAAGPSKAGRRACSGTGSPSVSDSGSNWRWGSPPERGARQVSLPSPKSTLRTGRARPTSYSRNLWWPVPTNSFLPAAAGTKASAEFQGGSMSPSLLGFAPLAWNAFCCVLMFHRESSLPLHPTAARPASLLTAYRAILTKSIQSMILAPIQMLWQGLTHFWHLAAPR